MICGGSGLFRNPATFYPTNYGLPKMWDKSPDFRHLRGQTRAATPPRPIGGIHVFGARSATPTALSSFWQARR